MSFYPAILPRCYQAFAIPVLALATLGATFSHATQTDSKSEATESADTPSSKGGQMELVASPQAPEAARKSPAVSALTSEPLASQSQDAKPESAPARPGLDSQGKGVVLDQPETSKPPLPTSSAGGREERATQETLQGERALFAHSLSDLGLAMLRASPAQNNAAVSPVSLTNALGLVHLAARGAGAKELSNLYQPSVIAEPLLQRRMQELNSILAQPSSGVTYTSANKLWIRESLARQIPANYAQEATRIYRAQAQGVAFEDAPGAARAINDWASQATENLIPEILKPSQIRADTQMVAANAVYFRGTWSTPFETANTTSRTFTLLDGTEVQVPTMRGTVSGQWARNPQADVVQLPYGTDGQTVMTILLPSPKTSLDRLQAQLSASQWAQWNESLKPVRMDLSLPRFKVGEGPQSLKPLLQNLGVKTLFGPQADLSGLSPSNGLKLDEVFQSAVVQTDEQGTRAAAVSAVVAVAKGLVLPERVVIDRPFLFSIVHLPTQTTLFMGRVSRPVN